MITLTFAGIDRNPRFDHVYQGTTPMAGFSVGAGESYPAGAVFAFDRTADLAGLGFWIGRLDAGTSLREVAVAFVAAQEFRDVYGAAPGNAGIVEKLYRHVLHRAPDAASSFWVDVLDSGAASVADVLVGFSESAENVAQLAGAVRGGIAFLPYV